MASTSDCGKGVFPYGDFRQAPYMSISLNEQGQMIQKRVRLSIQYHSPNSENTFTEKAFVSPYDLFEEKMKEFVLALKTDATIAHYDIDDVAEEPLAITPPASDLKERIHALLEENQMKIPSQNVFDVIMTAYSACQYFQKIYAPSSIIGVSSKSAPFALCNKEIREANNGKNRSEPEESTASITVFPSGVSYISFPMHVALKGGTKKISPVVFIGNQHKPSLSLMMRNKVQTDKRLKEIHTRLIENVTLVSSLSISRALQPMLIFSTPKKGIQFLTLKRQKDLYEYLLLYAQWRRASQPDKDQKLTAIIVEGLLEHVQELCTVMMQSFECLEQFHANGLLHNDIKPDNFLLSIDEHGEIQTELADYDFCCPIQKGKDSSFKGGTPLFEKKAGQFKDFRTELFAFGQTLSFEPRDYRYYPSFADGFLCFLEVCRMNEQYSYLVPQLEEATEKIRRLGAYLRYGVLKEDQTHYPSLAEIKDKLLSITKLFKSFM